MDSYTNLIVCYIQSHNWWLEKVYHNATDIVYVTLLVDVYVMLCVCMSCYFYPLKEGAGESRWEGEDGVVVLYTYISKEGAAGAGRCEDGVWHYVLLNEERGQRELLGVKTRYEMGCMLWSKDVLIQMHIVVCLSLM